MKNKLVFEEVKKPLKQYDISPTCGYTPENRTIITNRSISWMAKMVFWTQAYIGVWST